MLKLEKLAKLTEGKGLSKVLRNSIKGKNLPLELSWERRSVSAHPKTWVEEPLIKHFYTTNPRLA